MNRGGRGRGGPNSRGGRGRGGGRGSGRGGGRGGRGGERPPAGLSGRDIGMWYASRSKANRANEKENAPSFKFSPQQKSAIRTLKHAFTDPEIRQFSSKKPKLAEHHSTRLPGEFSWFDKIKQSPNVKKPEENALTKIRKNLPAYHMFETEIYPKIENNQVIVLAGATGCGKTTQVPQMILDKLIEKGDFSGKIVCTQPRRIAATSVGRRVHQERNNDGSVGYHVKLDVKPPRDTSSLLYCTVV